MTFNAGEFVTASVLKGLRQEDSKTGALKCLSLLSNLSWISGVHGPLVFTELMCIIGKDCRNHGKAAGRWLPHSNSVMRSHSANIGFKEIIFVDNEMNFVQSLYV